MIEEIWEFFKDPATPLGPIDLVWIIYLIYGFLRGMFRGLPRELAGMLGTSTTLFCAWRFYGPVSEAIREQTRVESEAASSLLAYGMLVLVFLASWKLITFLLRKTLDWTCPDQLQNWGGAVLGLSKAVIIVCVILTAVNLSGHQTLRKELIQNSWFGRTTQSVIPSTLHELLPAVFPEPIYEGEDLPQPESEPEAEPEEESDGSGDA